jgi:hypothetical protein
LPAPVATTAAPGKLRRATVTTMAGAMTAIGAATQTTTVTIAGTKNTIRRMTPAKIL